MNRLNIIGETMKKNEGLDNIPDVDAIIKPSNKIVNLVVGTFMARIGAKLGAKSSGASLRTASLVTTAGKDVVDSLDVGRAKVVIKANI